MNAPADTAAPPLEEESAEASTELETDQQPIEDAEPVAEQPGAIQGIVLALWLSKSSAERLESSFGCEVTEDIQRASEATLIVVSSRCPRARVLPMVRDLRGGPPIAVVAHAGGEQIALEIMRAGAIAVVAEGNEISLRRLIEQTDVADEALVFSYEQRIGGSRTEEAARAAVDKTTGLAGSHAFEARVYELTQAGSPARVGFVSIKNFVDPDGLEAKGIEVLRRRLSIHFRDITGRMGADLYSLTPDRFAFIGRELTANETYSLGRSLTEITESFAPGGALPLALALGHAGPEISSDLTFLKELAERALEDAMKQEGSSVVNAEDLSSSLQSATELDLALKMMRYLSEQDGYPGSHSSRVSDYANELGRQLGFEGRELSRIRLAALLHDVGKVGLPPEAMRESDILEGPSLEAYRSHPQRGATYLRLSAGKEVSDAVRHHHEWWDGTGFPDGLKNEDIPIASRIIAVANAYDAYTTAPGEGGGMRSRAESMALLKEQAGTRFDPVIVEIAETSLGR